MEDAERLTPRGAASFGRPWVALTLALGLHATDEAASPLAFRGARALRPVAYALGALMTANGLAHIIASLVTGRLIPGVYSAPVLLAAALWLLVTLRRTTRSEATTNP